MVRAEGFEPPRPCGHQLLRLARLPVPPRPHGGSNYITKVASIVTRGVGVHLSFNTDQSSGAALESGSGMVSRAAMKKAPASREKAGPMPWRTARAPMMNGAAAEKMRPTL
jgi:hypothetical protein